MQHRILQLEINEIPWRFLNTYRGRPEYPHIDAFFKKARNYTLKVVDGGEMSPWVVWPTLHRGINGETHGIHSIGQDPSTFNGTPIWDEVLGAGKNVGLFGPLQSWPPKDPGENGFYIPDTFSRDSSCVPARLSPLQEFNLSLVGRNSRVRRGGLLKSINWQMLGALPSSGIRLRTLAAIARQLIQEKADSRYCARRSIFQNILFWDVFKALYDFRNPPVYSSYFSNHLASALHRYWNYAFPDDFPPERRPKDNFHNGTLDFAMHVLDEMLADVLYWMAENPSLTVIFVSGLGQDAIVRKRHEGTELAIRDISRLLVSLNFPKECFWPLLAMMPQVAVDIPDHHQRIMAKKAMESLTCVSGLRPIQVVETGQTLSISVSNPGRKDSEAGHLYLKGRSIPYSLLGMELLYVEPGTAYHIPEAIFAIAGAGAEDFSRGVLKSEIPGDQVKKHLMKLLGI